MVTDVHKPVGSRL